MTSIKFIQSVEILRHLIINSLMKYDVLVVKHDTKNYYIHISQLEGLWKIWEQINQRIITKWDKNHAMGKFWHSHDPCPFHE